MRHLLASCLAGFLVVPFLASVVGAPVSGPVPEVQIEEEMGGAPRVDMTQRLMTPGSILAPAGAGLTVAGLMIVSRSMKCVECAILFSAEACCGADRSSREYRVASGFLGAGLATLAAGITMSLVAYSYAPRKGDSQQVAQSDAQCEAPLHWYQGTCVDDERMQHEIMRRKIYMFVLGGSSLAGGLLLTTWGIAAAIVSRGGEGERLESDTHDAVYPIVLGSSFIVAGFVFLAIGLDSARLRSSVSDTATILPTVAPIPGGGAVGINGVF